MFLPGPGRLSGDALSGDSLQADAGGSHGPHPSPCGEASPPSFIPLNECLRPRSLIQALTHSMSRIVSCPQRYSLPADDCNRTQVVKVSCNPRDHVGTETLATQLELTPFLLCALVVRRGR